MPAVVLENSVRIPAYVVGLASFRRWAKSDSFPERGQFSYLKDEVWIDMSPEDLFRHNQVKGEIVTVLTTLAKRLRLGRFFHDGALLTHTAVGLSTEPDGLFISNKTFISPRLRLIRGRKGFIEIQGSPDMALEVVSETSVKKDTEILHELYWRARVREYWIADARGAVLRFGILRRTRAGFVAAPKKGGWQVSSVFGKDFKLTVADDEMGNPEYTLHVR